MFKGYYRATGEHSTGERRQADTVSEGQVEHGQERLMNTQAIKQNMQMIVL